MSKYFEIKCFKYLGKRIVNNITVYFMSDMFPFRTLVLDEDDISILKKDQIFITIPNSARAGTGEEETWVRWVDGKKIREKYLPVARSYTVRNIYGYARTENIISLPAPGEGDIDIEVIGKEVVQTNTVGLPEWRVSRKIYFKYFWLFYIVAKDYWDKYPDDIYIYPEYREEPYSEEERREILEQDKKVYEEALRLAKKNYPELSLTEKMVENKKKEGTYWEELEAVYQESKRLKEKIGEVAEEEEKNRDNK